MRETLRLLRGAPYDISGVGDDVELVVADGIKYVGGYGGGVADVWRDLKLGESVDFVGWGGLVWEAGGQVG